MTRQATEHDIEIEDPDDASGASSDHDMNYGAAGALVPLPVYEDARRSRVSGMTAFFRHVVPMFPSFPPPLPLGVRCPVVSEEFSAAGPRGWAGTMTDYPGPEDVIPQPQDLEGRKTD